MPVVQTNPTDELNGLQVAIQLATLGAIARAVVVLNRDYDQLYEGTFPLIMLRMDHFRIRRISGGQTGTKGQDDGNQSMYAVEIQDVVDPRNPAVDKVARSQSDIYTLIGAIVGYFDHLPNQSMPIAGQATCKKAGEYIDFKMPRPFSSLDGGDVRVVAGGLISVIGLPRLGQAT